AHERGEFEDFRFLTHIGRECVQPDMGETIGPFRFHRLEVGFRTGANAKVEPVSGENFGNGAPQTLGGAGNDGCPVHLKKVDAGQSFAKKSRTFEAKFIAVEGTLTKFNYLTHLGRYLLMMKHAFNRPEKFSMYWKETMRQMNDIGIGSLIIVCLISVFI